MKKYFFLFFVFGTSILSASVYYYFSGKATEPTFGGQRFSFTGIDIDPSDWSLSGVIFLPSSGTASVDFGTLIQNGCLFGSITSINAGKIYFDNNAGLSYACLDQNTGKLRSDAYMKSLNLGNISLSDLYFSDTASNGVLPVILSCTDTISTQSIKILGMTSSENIREAFGQNSVTVFGSLSQRDLLNRIRKNVAISTRNAGTRTDFANGVYFRTNTSLSSISPIQKTKDAIVVMGGDLIIDVDTKDIAARTYISIKDSAGNGGNIYITSTPRFLDGIIIAEGSIFAGNGPGDLAINNCTPYINQLYIRGSLIGYNTIGGALGGSQYLCPNYIISPSACDELTAKKYDLGLLRYFRPGTPPLGLPIPLAELSVTARSYSGYAIVIEQDPSITINPPDVLIE